MRYLNKIVFLNSAHVPYAEVQLDGNVHFIGTQGVGKSTLLRALLFFYNADKLRLGIPKEKKGFDAFYFPYSNSYIVYEVMRENGAYCVVATKSQGRVAFRFVDAPFSADWFIDEQRQVRTDWSRIRERIGKAHAVSALVTNYETYRDIIFGNNRRQELITFRKYAIVESAKYQNIPRTIQNVFLNSKLDADFIKDTIIRSMSDEEVTVDLNFYRGQIKEFEQQYNDVMLWFEKNKNGEVPIRKVADKVIAAYRNLLYTHKLIVDGRAELNTAEKQALLELPCLQEHIKTCEDKRSQVLRLRDELQQKYQKERDDLNNAIGRVEADLKRARQKRQEYERMNIDEMIRRVAQEPFHQQELEHVQAMRQELTRAHQDILSKYRPLIEAEETAFHTFQNGKQALVLQRQAESGKRREEALQHLREEEERIRDAAADKQKAVDERMQQHRDEQGQVKQQLLKLSYENPYDKETAACTEDIAELKKKEQELNFGVRECQMECNRLRQEYEGLLKDLQRDYSQRMDIVRRQKVEADEAVSALDALLEKRKDSFSAWLEQHKPGWQDSIGKVADEETILYNADLKPTLLSNDNGDSFFGVSIDLAGIERRVRTPEELRQERAEKQVVVSDCIARLNRLTEEQTTSEERLKKKCNQSLREWTEKQHLLETELLRLPVALKNLQADLASWRKKTDEWRRTQSDALQEKLNEIAHQLYKADEEKKLLASECQRRLKAAQKQYKEQCNILQAEQEQFAANVKQEVEAHRLQMETRIQELRQAQNAELSGKGSDVGTLYQYDQRIDALRKELDYIREHRTLVTYYEKDKQELFDREPLMQTEKKKLEDKLAALDERYALRKERLQHQQRQADDELAVLRKQQQDLHDGLNEVAAFRHDATFCPPDSMEVGDRPTRKDCKTLVTELKSLIVSTIRKTDEFKKLVMQFSSYFSPKNTFHFRTELVSEEDYYDFASNLCEFVDNDKIADYQKHISERYTDILRRISKEVGDLTRNEGEIRKTIDAINADFIERNFTGVIREIALRPLPSSDKLMQLLLEIKKFNDEHQFNMGVADLFSQASREDVNASAVRYLLAFMKNLLDDPGRKLLQLSDTFNLEFRVKENDNDTGWVEKIANVGSDGTDILVKAMVNIMLINVFKEKASRKFGDFKLHCMMDEIGKLHPNNVKGILDFANCRNILLVNSSPTTYNVEDYRYTYLLSKDGHSNTKIVPLIRHTENL
ncbi:MAG: ATP-binding protein [Bacteroides sp.]|nr:ATP-binding protein [Bacteroides sp.]